MKNDIVIFGAGGHANSVTNVAISCGFRIAAYVDDEKKGQVRFDAPVIGEHDFFSENHDANIFVAIGDNYSRKKIVNKIRSNLDNAKFPPLIHPSSVVGIESEIGNGAVVMPLANIGPQSIISDFSIINSKVSIDHNSFVGEYSSLAPGTTTGGNVTVGIETHIGLNATIKHGITIGDHTVIGSNSYVHENMGDHILAYGAPCRSIKSRHPHDKYLD